MRGRTYVLFLDLRLFLGGKVVDNVEKFTDFLGCLTLNHVSHSLASNITEHRMLRQFNILRAIDSQQRLDIKVIGSENDLKEHLLIDGDELLVPFANVSCSFSRIILVRIRIGCGQRLALVVLAIFEDLEDAQIRLITREAHIGELKYSPSSRHSTRHWAEE